MTAEASGIQVDVTGLRHRVRAVMPEVLAALEGLVRIPSVAFAGYPREPVETAAGAVADLFRNAGLPEVRLLDVPPDPPAVFAARPASPGAPTVLLYAHYDVQPAGNESVWRTPPYEPVVRDGRLYGRGSSDDKAGVVAHLGALLALGDDCPVGVKVLIEGAEEGGSAGLEAFVPAHADLVAADAMVVCDLGNVRLGQPTLITSLRGIAVVDVEVETLAAPVHSGSYGAAAPDALVALVRMLATLHDERGNPAVEGLAKLPYEGTQLTEEAFRAEAGVLPGVDLVGDGTIADRVVTGPAISVIGIDVADVESAPNIVIPRARARVSVRVAPAQDPHEAAHAVVRHLQTRAPWHVRAKVTVKETGDGFRAADGGPAYRAAVRALETAYERPVTEIGEGGSIPLVAALQRAAPSAVMVLIGPGDPTSNAHAPNESVDLSELERSVLGEALFLGELGKGGL